jgi:hypothetical protein
MAIYNPPTETLPIFDSSVFESNSAGLTIAEGDARYLRFPVSQGSETISGALVVSGTITTDDIAGSAVGTAVSLFNEATRTGTITIGTGASSKTITIGNNTGGNFTLNGANLLLRPTTLVAIGDTMTSGEIRIAPANTTTTSTVINIGTGSALTGAINIGTGSSTKTVTIGRALGSNTLNLNAHTVALQTGTGSVLIGTTATAGTITIGNASNALTIQRPIQLNADANPASATTAIGYVLPLVTGTSIAIAVPTNSYTWSTGLMTLGIGVWMLSLEAEYISTLAVANFTNNMGFMSSVPVTGDSATASKAPTNTISGINGNLRDDMSKALTNGTYIDNVAGVVVNNYGGTFNSIYGIMNADWTTTGLVAMTSLSIRAVKIG